MGPRWNWGHKLIDKKWEHVSIDKSMINYLKEIKSGNKKKFMANYYDTHEILTNVDAVISPLSTILIEAAIHGKPSLCFFTIL